VFEHRVIMNQKKLCMRVKSKVTEFARCILAMQGYWLSCRIMDYCISRDSSDNYSFVFLLY